MLEYGHLKESEIITYVFTKIGVGLFGTIQKTLDCQGKYIFVPSPVLVVFDSQYMRVIATLLDQFNSSESAPASNIESEVVRERLAQLNKQQQPRA